MAGKGGYLPLVPSQNGKTNSGTKYSIVENETDEPQKSSSSNSRTNGKTKKFVAGGFAVIVVATVVAVGVVVGTRSGE